MDCYIPFGYNAIGFSLQMQVTMGERFTMVIKDSKVYSCGRSVWALGHGKETRRCFELKPIDLPFSAQVSQVSASGYNVAFLMQSGEVGYFCFFWS